MQREGPLVGAIELVSVPVHAIAHQARGQVERVAFIRPPAVHAGSEHRAMHVPIAARLQFRARLVSQVSRTVPWNWRIPVGYATCSTTLK